MREEEVKLRETVDELHAIKSLRLDTIMVSVVDSKNQTIWAHGFKNGNSCGISNRSLDLKKIVEIIEIALAQAKGELSIANGELIPADDTN